MTRETPAMRQGDALTQERGTAIVIAIFSIMLLAALGSALVLLTVTETGLSANYRDAVRTLYAADAAVTRAVMDLSVTDDWTAVLSGARQSSFTDGLPSGARQLAGIRIDLDELTNRLRCGSSYECDPAAPTAERPWGTNNPVWQLYAWGPLNRLQESAADGDVYVCVWVGDDPDETDGNPLMDESEAGQAGHGVVRVVAQAFGPQNARRTVAVSLARRIPASADSAAADSETAAARDGPYVQLLSWREVR
jgi:hypothetical protein